MTLKTSERGYGHAHQLVRQRWRPLVESGVVECARVDCLRVAEGGSRLILPGDAWDLGHDRAAGTWHGPEHARCNRSEGARFGARLRRVAEFGVGGSPGRLRW